MVLALDGLRRASRRLTRLGPRMGRIGPGEQTMLSIRMTKPTSRLQHNISFQSGGMKIEKIGVSWPVDENW